MEGPKRSMLHAVVEGRMRVAHAFALMVWLPDCAEMLAELRLAVLVAGCTRGVATMQEFAQSCKGRGLGCANGADESF